VQHSPFPADSLTVSDSSQITGKRVNLPLPDCTAQAALCAELGLVNQLDGFNLRPRIAAESDDSLFLIEAAALTGTGGVIGVIVGLTLGKVASLLLNVHGSTPINLTLLAVAVSVGIGLLFGVLPARRAARLDPIESLRYE